MKTPEELIAEGYTVNAPRLLLALLDMTVNNQVMLQEIMTTLLSQDPQMQEHTPEVRDAVIAKLLKDRMKLIDDRSHKIYWEVLTQHLS